MKVLLRVDALQSTLLVCLLQKLPELVSSTEEDEENEGKLMIFPEMDVPRLILAHIRWIDYVVDPAALTHANTLHIYFLKVLVIIQKYFVVLLFY